MEQIQTDEQTTNELKLRGLTESVNFGVLHKRNDNDWIIELTKLEVCDSRLL